MEKDDNRKKKMVPCMIPIDIFFVLFKLPSDIADEVKQLVDQYKSGKYGTEEFQQLLKKTLGFSDIYWKEFKQDLWRKSENKKRNDEGFEWAG